MGHLVWMRRAENRGGETVTPKEKGKTTCEMGGLRKEGCKKRGGG